MILYIASLSYPLDLFLRKRVGTLLKGEVVPKRKVNSGWWLRWHPSLIRHNTNFWPYYWSGPYYRIWLSITLREVSIEHLQRVRHANRGRFWTLKSSNFETNLSWTCLVSGLWVSNIPRYFYFALNIDWSYPILLFPMGQLHLLLKYVQ